MTATLEIATDPTTLAIQQVADIIAANAAWQASIAKYSADEAREYIVKSYFVVPDGKVMHPWAVIYEQAGTRWERRADGTVLPRGELMLDLICPQETGDTELEERRFNNWCGSISRDLSTYNGPGYRLLTVQTQPPEHTPPKDSAVQSYWDVGYTVTWDCFG